MIDLPVGTTVLWPSDAIPAGWLICDGGSVPPAKYPDLARVLAAGGGNNPDSSRSARSL